MGSELLARAIIQTRGINLISGCRLPKTFLLGNLLREASTCEARRSAAFVKQLNRKLILLLSKVIWFTSAESFGDVVSIRMTKFCLLAVVRRENYFPSGFVAYKTIKWKMTPVDLRLHCGTAPPYNET